VSLYGICHNAFCIIDKSILIIRDSEYSVVTKYWMPLFMFKISSIAGDIVFNFDRSALDELMFCEVIVSPYGVSIDGASSHALCLFWVAILPYGVMMQAIGTYYFVILWL